MPFSSLDLDGGGKVKFFAVIRSSMPVDDIVAACASLNGDSSIVAGMASDFVIASRLLLVDFIGYIAFSWGRRWGQCHGDVHRRIEY